MGELCGFRIMVHVLHSKEFQLFGGAFEILLVYPGMGRVGGDNPQAFDAVVGDALEDLIVGPAVGGGDGIQGKAGPRSPCLTLSS